MVFTGNDFGYGEITNCRVCGTRIDKGPSNLCFRCGRKIHEPCGTSELLIRNASLSEIERVKQIVDDELRRRGYANT